MRTTSPFAGMDPYLEGFLWPDVHHHLASAIREILAPKIAPKYVTLVDTYTMEDREVESEIGILYPDVAVLRRLEVEEAAVPYGEGRISPPTAVVEAMAVEVRIPVVHIRDQARRRLITCIEVLSPVHKRGEGWRAYEERRRELHAGGVHVLEIDLLRRGRRHVPPLVQLPEHHYCCSLWRVRRRKMELWAVHLFEPLPVLPVPLRHPDADVALPLRQALDMIYQRGLYSLSIDYEQEPPPPPFSEGERAWMRQLLAGNA